MTIAQALAEGGQTAVIGLATVFSVLIILMIVITIMKMMFYKDPAKSAVKETPAPAAPVEPAKPVEQVKADEMDDEELVAVITAAIAASLNTSTYNLRIKSLRRIDNNQPAWNKAGIRETINNRF